MLIPGGKYILYARGFQYKSIARGNTEIKAGSPYKVRQTAIFIIL